MTKVLFVCLGNICRSPMAKAVFQHLVELKGLSDKIYIDAAGLISYHQGAAPDHRTVQTLKKYNVPVQHKARQVTEEDFYTFDYMIAMDRQNLRELQEMRPKDAKSAMCLMRNWDNEAKNTDVQDPYLGGLEGFEESYSILERSCRNLLAEIMAS